MDKILSIYFKDEYDYDDYLDELIIKSFNSNIDLVLTCDFYNVNCNYLYFDEAFNLKVAKIDLGFQKSINISALD